MNGSWYALICTPRGEMRADEELASAGIERFTPTFKRRCLVRYTKGREKEFTLPLLTGYVFARLDYSPHSHHPTLLADCDHIVGPIKICGKAVPVHSAELRQLRLLCDAGAFDQGRLRGQDNRFRDGDPVRIREGSWAGYVMKFRETAGGLKPRMGYVRLAMERLFGQENFEMDVPLALVEAA